MTKVVAFRLAMRVEGNWWVAYMARAGTMDDAKRIGSILMGAVNDNPERKQAFMALMQDVMSDAIKAVTGQVVDWNEPQTAPESERAGRA